MHLFGVPKTGGSAVCHLHSQCLSGLIHRRDGYKPQSSAAHTGREGEGKERKQELSSCVHIPGPAAPCNATEGGADPSSLFTVCSSCGQIRQEWLQSTGAPAGSDPVLGVCGGNGQDQAENRLCHFER